MRLKILLGLCTLVLVNGCYQEASYDLEDFVAVLNEDKDFQDFNSDFKTAFERDFEAVEIEVVELNKTIIQVRKNQFENNLTTKPFAVIYEDLPDKSSLFEVWLKDKADESRSIVSVLDMEQNKVLKFYALIGITDKINLQGDIT